MALTKGIVATNLNGTTPTTPTAKAPVDWELRVNVTEFDVIEYRLRVTNETHIGGVMFQLVEQLNNIKNDWSDFALWWPKNNQWLNKTKWTLEKYGVQADALLHFTRIHKSLRVQLPDLQIILINVDFSISLFHTVKQITKDLGIRHSEEISLVRCPKETTSTTKKSKDNKKERSTNNNNNNNTKNESKLQTSKSTMLNTSRTALNGASTKDTNGVGGGGGSVSSSATSTLNNSSSNNSNGTYKFQRERSHSLSIENGNGSLNGFNTNAAGGHVLYNDPQSLTLSPIVPTQDHLNKLNVKYKTIFDKTRINSRWLDSSKSLMEQDIDENDLVQLRFKYFAFFELNSKYDSIRINQIYEQAKWSILAEEIDCTEQELISFAALQLQIQLQTKTLSLSSNSKSIDLISQISLNPNDHKNSIITLSSSNGYSSTLNLNGNGPSNNNNNNNGRSSTTRSITRLNSLNLDDTNKYLNDKFSSEIDDDDDVDTALSKLEKSLDVAQLAANNANNANNINKNDLINSNSKTNLQNDTNYNQNSNNGNGSFTNGFNSIKKYNSLDKPPPAPNNNNNNGNSQVKSSFDQKKQNNNNFMNTMNSCDYTNELCEELFLMKQQKYTFKKFKSYYFVLNDTHYLSYYKSKEESNGRPVDKINLRGCELVPDVNVAGRKFGINLKVPSPDGMIEMSLRCPNEESYAQWMSACKLASKNKSISDSTFHTEVKSILNLLQMQQNKPLVTNLSLIHTSNGDSNNKTNKSHSLMSSTPSIDTKPNDNAEVQAFNLLPTRMLKKFKLKQLNDRILEAYSSISDLDLFEAKWHYIKGWQALPSYGITYFAVKVKSSRFREEIIGVTSNRMLRINPEGETLKAWRFNTMKSWNVNWDIKQFEIIFDEELLVFTCLDCDAKILHEFIGGYIYLSLRNQEKSEPLDDDMFFKLTEKR